MAISSNNHTTKAQMTFRLYAWQCLKGTHRVRFVPLFQGSKREELKRLLVIIPKVVISLLMVSRGIIPFEKHIAAVGIIPFGNYFYARGKVLAPHASVTRDDSLQSSVQI